jgi:hypothetical protein
MQKKKYFGHQNYQRNNIEKQQNVENHMDCLRHTDEYGRPVGAHDEELLVGSS